MTQLDPVRFQFSQRWGISPMDERDPFVMKAIRNVVGRQPSNEWWAMPPALRTQAIYAEIRRLDAETVQQSSEERSPPVERLLYVGV